jgi:hypothetical protein
VVVAILLAVGVTGPTSPVGAADAPLSLLGEIRHPVSGVYIGTGTTEAFSTPAIADVTGDGRPDLVVGSVDGQLEAHTLPGRTLIWSVSVGRSAIESSPVIVDLTGDGRRDIVVGTMDGRVLVIDGPTGAVVRTFQEQWPLYCPPEVDCRPHGFFATPAVADIDADGILDIIAPSWDHTVYAWSSTGAFLWRRYIEDTLWSSPVVVDIDRNGTPEIILGGDIWAGNPLGAPEGGLVWILNRDGSTYPGYPKHVPLQTVWSTPAVADIDLDGWLDVVVGTGTHFPDPGGRWVDAFTARTGRSLPGWPASVAGRAMTSPALGQLDGDPALEVVAGAEGGFIHALDTDGRELWRSCESGHPQGCFEGYSTHGGVAIADVDDDGLQEVVAAFDHELRVHDGRTGRTEAARRLSSGLALTPASTPVVAEIDGRTQIAVSYFYEQATHVDLFTTGRRLCRADWPTFLRGPRRTGRFHAVAGATDPFRCPADFVAQQYRDFLGRDVDSHGSAFWLGQVDAGWTGARIIRSFMTAPEYRRVVAPGIRAHLAVTGTHPPSSQAVRDGATAIRSGLGPALVADGVVVATGAARLPPVFFVQAVFVNIFGRAPNLVELTLAVHRLQTGESRGSLVAGWTEGGAGAARLAAPVDVAMTYLGMLDRAPDRAGWDYWVAATRRSGLEALIAGVQRSPEYRQRIS